MFWGEGCILQKHQYLKRQRRAIEMFQVKGGQRDNNKNNT